MCTPVLASSLALGFFFILCHLGWLMIIDTSLVGLYSDLFLLCNNISILIVYVYIVVNWWQENDLPLFVNLWMYICSFHFSWLSILNSRLFVNSMFGISMNSFFKLRNLIWVSFLKAVDFSLICNILCEVDLGSILS